MRYASLRVGLQLAICPSVSGGGGVVPDLSGRGIHGTLTNMDALDYITYHRGMALDFDGVNDRVVVGTLASSVPNILSLSVDFFYSLWVLPTGTISLPAQSTSGFGGLSGQRYAIDPFYRDPPNSGVGISVGTNGIVVAEHSASLCNSLAVLATTINQWTHLLVHISDKTPKIYINGVLLHTGLTSPRTSVQMSSNEIGASRDGFGFYSGQLDDVRFYSRQLTGVDICLLASEPGIGLRPERTSVFFGAQLFQAAWLAKGRNIIGGGVC